MGAFKTWTYEQLSQYLQKEAERIIRECKQEAEYTTRTSNLDDSFGYAVILNGKMVHYGFLGDKAATVPRRIRGKNLWGRVEINSSLKKLEGRVQNGIIIFAAMPYAKWLENGSGGIQRKYKVISMSYDKLGQLQSIFKNSTVEAIT